MTIIIQLILIVGCAKATGLLFRRLGQPQVCGEIAAGIILGPSLFGALWPHAQRMVFSPSASDHLTVLSEVGLIFIMFIIGLEFDFSHLATSTRAVFLVSTAGILVPFLLGVPLGRWIYFQMGLNVNKVGFTLFVATALSMTAVPVLGRIVVEFNLGKSRLAALAIGAAAMDDAVGWLLLALVSDLVVARFQPTRILVSAAGVAIYLLAMIFLVRPLLKRWTHWAMSKSGHELPPAALAQLIIMFFASAAVTSAIGIFPVFGAFVMGAVLHDQKALCEAVGRQMRDFVTVFFLPVFFTFTGLRTDISSLDGKAGLLAGVVILVAATGKFGGCSVAARLGGLSWRESFSIGAMMNTRGLVDLVVLNTGYDLGIIPKPVFSIFVVMVLFSTYMTAPALRRLIRGTELQAQFEVSTFMEGRASPAGGEAAQRGTVVA
ncbi:MAG TPA: cation:proton antiporter [Candidatus Saccharimonadales bacterium]|jgi:Kef-type K+ transport system membrane component KefB|nr:cation:proton antiporter [Candidatus Saccharimonadales bacterium]